jgi:hypothetical protein
MEWLLDTVAESGLDATRRRPPGREIPLPLCSLIWFIVF